MEVMIGLVVCACVLTALWGSRAHWMHKQCPACRLRMPYLATKCPHCHTPQSLGPVCA